MNTRRGCVWTRAITIGVDAHDALDMDTMARWLGKRAVARSSLKRSSNAHVVVFCQDPSQSRLITRVNRSRSTDSTGQTPCLTLFRSLGMRGLRGPVAAVMSGYFWYPIDRPSSPSFSHPTQPPSRHGALQQPAARLLRRGGPALGPSPGGNCGSTGAWLHAAHDAAGGIVAVPRRGG